MAKTRAEYEAEKPSDDEQEFKFASDAYWLHHGCYIPAHPIPVRKNVKMSSTDATDDASGKNTLYTIYVYVYIYLINL